MLCISLESKKFHGEEFDSLNDSDSAWDIPATLREYGIEGMEEEAINRLRGVFTICRAAYRVDVEGSYTITLGALFECLRRGQCPTRTSIGHYREATGCSL
jgi:hypothetical protein